MEFQSEGGKARAAALSQEERSNIARAAARSRWVAAGKSKLAVAEFGAPNRPLVIGGVSMPCYVLADGRRVLAQRGLQAGLGLSEGGGKRGLRKIVELLLGLVERGADTGDLIARADAPIRFIPPHGGNPADGYEASILPDLCAVILKAHLDGQLYPGQVGLARRAQLLQHGFATVGIHALIDEATGYQEVRARDALAKILEEFVAKEMQPWVKTFPADYYREIFRLYGWGEYSAGCPKPSVLGHLTNNLIYSRLAPGVLDALKKATPRDEKGRLKHRLFQRLTDAVGHPKLREHLTGVVMLLKYSPTWDAFMERLDKEFPKWDSADLDGELPQTV